MRPRPSPDRKSPRQRRRDRWRSVGRPSRRARRCPRPSVQPATRSPAPARATRPWRRGRIRPEGASSCARATNVSADSGLLPASACCQAAAWSSRSRRSALSVRSKPTVAGRRGRPRAGAGRRPAAGIRVGSAGHGRGRIETLQHHVLGGEIERCDVERRQAQRGKRRRGDLAPRSFKRRTRIWPRSPRRRATKASAAGARRARGVSLAYPGRPRARGEGHDQPLFDTASAARSRCRFEDVRRRCRPADHVGRGGGALEVCASQLVHRFGEPEICEGVECVDDVGDHRLESVLLSGAEGRLAGAGRRRNRRDDRCWRFGLQPAPASTRRRRAAGRSPAAHCRSCPTLSGYCRRSSNTTQSISIPLTPEVSWMPRSSRYPSSAPSCWPLRMPSAIVSARRTAVEVRPVANGASAPPDAPPCARHAARSTPAVLACRGDGAITKPPPDGSVTVPSGIVLDAGTVVSRPALDAANGSPCADLVPALHRLHSGEPRRRERRHPCVVTVRRAVDDCSGEDRTPVGRDAGNRAERIAECRERVAVEIASVVRHELHRVADDIGEAVVDRERGAGDILARPGRLRPPVSRRSSQR